MRTSHTQYTIMVEFMEKHGDLSKPNTGARGRHYVLLKWKELADMLNCESTGDPRTEEKWRKVWSDYKNNVKKKWAKINRSAQGTGGGPALQLILTDLENRVLDIIGVQAATGMAIKEAGFGDLMVDCGIEVIDDESIPTQHTSIPITEESWNTPSTSNQPTVAPPVSPFQSPAPPDAEVDTQCPPPKKRKRMNNANDEVLNMFKECERNTREYERERERVMIELERERLRQRDLELQLQAQWLEFMKEGLKVFERYMDRKE